MLSFAVFFENHFTIDDQGTARVYKCKHYDVILCNSGKAELSGEHTSVTASVILLSSFLFLFSVCLVYCCCYFVIDLSSCSSPARQQK